MNAAEAAEALASRHNAWARSIARSQLRSVPAIIDVSDLEQSAQTAVWMAASRYDSGRATKFQGACGPARQGAIQDFAKRNLRADHPVELLPQLPAAPVLRTSPPSGGGRVLLRDERRGHNSDYIRIGLTRTIAQELGLTIDFTDETSLLSAESRAFRYQCRAFPST